MPVSGNKGLANQWLTDGALHTVTGQFGPETDRHSDTSALFRWVGRVWTFRHQYRSVQKTVQT